ncbi:uncharacterized protein MONOS_10591 [Monocercomonoides exilis]|uniref:uncharacterized protein n=1 Tax=Monocercomonoides exilis TaxID=2049356 RepID=UPI0035593922|nr:hypothetical protein MONOS_10591 [Monocercomonoides exilis]|eukprot:MONOS_10591.1-p1 / transcript=MONOS_10591.1 / gene=MONOS_10591 / organism=Monocercomonoides_exilis_PA203 / gene_product=unspecified product / transcript_product=unspecified product / location=Mono_scaffold00487:28122-28649(-) / protein_length=158 / sequence_SO=supercontig / SO=protein_coding / is_pseudo=false
MKITSTIDTTSGALYVKSEHIDSIFTIENNGITKFDGCTCAKGNSGGRYLEMTAITEATQLSWPETGDNLVFTGCTAGDDDSKKNTGIYLDVPDALHRAIAAAMKMSFAAGYVVGENDCVVAAKFGNDDIDFTAKYFDAKPLEVYVMKSGTGDGTEY